MRSTALHWPGHQNQFYFSLVEKRRKKKSELFLIGPKWLFSLNNDAKEEVFDFFQQAFICDHTISKFIPILHA